MACELNAFANLEISVAMTAQDDRILGKHLHKERRQEDLAFAYWRPSRGARRFTAIITKVLLPREEDRSLHGNVSFKPEYLRRVLAELPDGCGIAFLHGHPVPGWQEMSHDDIVAERDRLAGPVAGRTGLPLLGMIRGTDGAWSARLWLRDAPHSYRRHWVRSARVIGATLNVTYNPAEPSAPTTDSQVATESVWGKAAQERLVRVSVGVVGLGSVGSLVAEALSRVGFQDLTYIDFDAIEPRNLDRTLGASRRDIGHSKVSIAARTSSQSATARRISLREVPCDILSPEGLSAALDCDVLVCCVDRPWPRHLLNSLAYSHLIPVIDGGIFAAVKPDGTPLHVTWRIHTVGPEHACMV